MSATNWALARSCPRPSSSYWVSESSAMPPRCGAGCSGLEPDEVSVSQAPPDRAADESRDAPIRHGHPPADDKANEAPQRGRHELPAKPPRPEIGSLGRAGLSALLH